VTDDVLRVEGGRAVDADAGVAAGAGRVDGDLGVAVVPRAQAVDRGGGEVAEDGGRAAGLHGGEEAAVTGRVGAADGVDAAMEWVERAALDAREDRIS
jgi:hypothetical protein